MPGGPKLTSCSTAIMAMLVLPAPVGAQTSRFSLLVKAVGKMRLWMRFRCLPGMVRFRFLDNLPSKGELLGFRLDQWQDLCIDDGCGGTWLQM